MRSLWEFHVPWLVLRTLGVRTVLIWFICFPRTIKTGLMYPQQCRIVRSTSPQGKHIALYLASDTHSPPSSLMEEVWGMVFTQIPLAPAKHELTVCLLLR